MLGVAECFSTTELMNKSEWVYLVGQSTVMNHAYVTQGLHTKVLPAFFFFFFFLQPDGHDTVQ